MSIDTSMLAQRGGTQPAIQRFNRTRKAISGLAEDGTPIGPGWFDPQVVSLAHGEGVRRPHSSVVAAGVRALVDSVESSLDNYRYLKPFKALDDKLTETYIAEGIDAQTAGNLCLDSGNTRLFFGFFHAVAEPGSIFLVPRAYYQAINMWCDISDVQLRWVDTSADNDYKLTADDLESWYDRNVRQGIGVAPRGILLFNPGYTGSVYQPHELAALAEFVERQNLVVLEDSIFSNTEFEGYRTTHLASFDGMAQRVVTINGGSKAYGLANIRIGWGCGPKAIIDRMNYYTMATSITVPHLAKAMALAALEAPRAYLDGNIRECMTRAALVEDLMTEVNQQVADAVGFEPRIPFFRVAHQPKAAHSTLVSGNGMAGLRLPDGSTITDSVDVTRHFLQQGKVCFSPALSNGFDDCTVRVAFGCLGWEHTYPETRLADTRAAVHVLLKEMPFGTDETELLARMRAAGIDPAWNCREDTNEGFALGREVIREAFTHRIAPVAVRLAEANRQLLAVEAPELVSRGR